ncbi:hypothetical protein IVB45_17305 [Bradyrhizobium sp. 4]|uniref:hypothetical protein n=1 Tax=unclassified Bradyrhizobium TaxID=2631580 RepID=UPI001FFB3DC5|nr:MULTISPECIES: hypothetical protein [unclassified Bradyrhizobium]MCK1402067.1 hypothetical protein [Bradyrhizobium sp. 39]MCK1751213.1 hypothetical protein [Bradyrhizobium sp. 135]UPJ38469.1 hypothetical protein IVB45_17305 [Bradyrhizobium sp. 4]
MMQRAPEITQVGRLVRSIENCRIAAARLEMQLCRCTAPSPEHLWRTVRRMREVADKLEGRTP